VIKKIVNWIKNNPVLAFLGMFVIVQTAINIVLMLRILQTQELLRKLVLRISLQQWSV